jgi:hypothetical protein
MSCVVEIWPSFKTQSKNNLVSFPSTLCNWPPFEASFQVKQFSKQLHALLLVPNVWRWAGYSGETKGGE